MQSSKFILLMHQVQHELYELNQVYKWMQTGGKKLQVDIKLLMRRLHDQLPIPLCHEVHELDQIATRLARRP